MASYSPENRNSKIARWRFDVGSEDATIDVAWQVAPDFYVNAEL